MKEKIHVSYLIGPALLRAAVRRALLCAGLAGSIGAANAQSTAASTTAGGAGEGLQEIVVTGTLIRGIAPVGTEVTTLTRDDIVSTGAVSTQDLLSTMPQITSAFNQKQNPNSSTGADIVRPNIHNIGAAGGNTTLVLFDGHDVVGSGIYQTTPDIGVIPPNVLQSVQVIADGGSALYGADAIGGIVNLITRKHMEGVEADGHYGWASAYHAEDANITGGHEWEGGSFLISYSYRSNNDLTGADRSYFSKNLVPFGGTDYRNGQSCPQSNVTVGKVSYAEPSLVAGTAVKCDPDQVTDLYPSEKQHSFFAAFSQDISSRVSFDVTAYYSYRQDGRLQAPLADGGTITNTNPYFIPVAGATSEQVGYSYGAVAVNDQINKINEGGITPEFKFQLGGDWELTTLLNYGRSITQVHSPITNTGGDAAAIAGTTIATALDPYDIAATNSSVLAPLLNWVQHTQDIQNLYEVKAVAQGTVLSLPGGNAKLAVGAQFERQILALQANGPLGNDTGVGAGCQYGNCSTASANNHELDTSAFGELLLPIVGSGNNFAGVRELDLDLQARFDRYNLNLGNTTNPKFAGTWKPLDDLTFRGTWGTSFTAPSMADLAGSVDYQAQVYGSSPFGPPSNNPADANRPTIILAGGGNVKPMTSTTYTAGFDYNPEWLKSTTVSMTYWDTVVKGLINIYPFYSGSYFFTNFPNAYYINPSLALTKSIIGNEHITESLAQLYSNPANYPYAILDAERTNLGNLYLKGVDFNLSFKQPTGFGSIYALVAGTYVLSQQSQNPGSAPVSNFTAGNGVSRLLFTAQGGAKVGQFTGGVTFNYSSGYLVSNTGQTSVGAFYPVNLKGAYDFGKLGGMQDLTVTLNLDNVFNMNPVFQNQVGSPQGDGIAANGGTVGRFVNLGVHAKF